MNKKIISLITSVSLLIYSASPVLAMDAPQAPIAPVAPEASATQTAPVAPTAPEAPKQKDNPKHHDRDESPTESTSKEPPSSINTDSSGSLGSTQIATGDANSNSSTITTANQNLSTSPKTSSNLGSGTNVQNSGNGSNSENDSQVSNSSNTNTNQNNSANINSDVNQSANTGTNNASNNVGDTLIKTGDANVSGTLITSANTNLDGLTIAEFNIADTHNGDYVLDFSANCISGCSNGNSSATNKGNGSGSNNNASISTTNNAATFQNNDANIGNSLVLAADSGNNVSNANTGGTTAISTGDANVSANVLNLANNNIAGNITYGVVNIYGSLYGDILFPEELANGASCCTANQTASNTGNGANSSNSSNISVTNSTNTNQANNAILSNEISADANTGGNAMDGNTGGDNLIYTGDANVTTQTLNVANNNVSSDGTLWLVLVNQAGNWLGQIVGAPAGTNFAASQGTGYSVSPSGAITASNNGNGASSQNSSDVSNSSTSTTNQTNNTNLDNKVQLSANTGNNSTSNNTGGDSGIATGDANIVANMVNFVNNNISSGGKMVVTVVNVFGDWIGNIVTPGQKQPEKTATVIPTSVPQKQATAIGGEQLTTTTAKSSTSQTISTPTTPSPANKVLIPKPKDVRLAAITSQEEVLGTTAKSSDVDQTVASASFTTSKPSKKVVNINLAWILLLVPVLPVILVARKKLLTIKKTTRV